MSFVKRVVGFCVSNEFSSSLFQFMDENAHIFEVDIDGSEHRLGFSEVHMTFCKIFESKIEDFISKQSYSVEDFYLFVKGAYDGGDGDMIGFVYSFVSLFDYEMFTEVMQSDAKRQYLRRIVESWASNFNFKK